jgi:hypothetical protein
MKPKKPQEPTAKDKDWQKKIEKRMKAEKVKLNHPNGKERFNQTIKRVGKKEA